MVSSQRQDLRSALELVNEGRCLAQPFEPLLGCQAVEFGVAVEIRRCAPGHVRYDRTSSRVDFLRRFIATLPQSISKVLARLEHPLAEGA